MRPSGSPGNHNKEDSQKEKSDIDLRSSSRFKPPTPKFKPPLPKKPFNTVGFSEEVSQSSVATIIANQTPFKAGGLQDSLHMWDAVTHCHIEFDFEPEPLFSATRPHSSFTEVEQSIIDNEIEKFLQKEIITLSSFEDGQVISPIFTRAKKDGSHRVTFNLKRLNESVSYHHFKMDTLETAIKLIRPSCFMTSIDLKDAYYSILVALEHQKYLKFIWRN